MQIKYISNTVTLHINIMFKIQFLVIAFLVCYIKSASIIFFLLMRTIICLYGCKVKLDTPIKCIAAVIKDVGNLSQSSEDAYPSSHLSPVKVHILALTSVQ